MNSCHSCWSFSDEKYLYWMISDQAQDFAKYLSPPIRDRRNFSENIQRYLKYAVNVDPHTLTVITEAELRKAMEILDHEGENTSVLWHWFAALRDDTGDIEMATRTWSDALLFWSKNKDSVNFDKKTMNLIDSFHKNATLRRIEFRKIAAVADVEWLSCRSARSDLDELLYQYFYKDVQISPVMYSVNLYHMLLQRLWWCDQFRIVDQEMEDALMQALVELAYDGKSLQIPIKAIRILPLDEVFDRRKGEFLANHQPLTKK